VCAAAERAAAGLNAFFGVSFLLLFGALRQSTALAAKARLRTPPARGLRLR
jgi:uncharacterized membrane protein